MRSKLTVLIFSMMNYFMTFVLLTFFVLKISSELFVLIVLALWLFAATVFERKHLKIRHIFLEDYPDVATCACILS